MPARDTVKTYQRRLAQLDGAVEAARSRLAAQQRKRLELIAAHDQLVQAAQDAVEQAVLEMATEVGPELTAHLTGRDVIEVRRQLRQQSKVGRAEG